ncbi:MAG: HEAT repeat domain-containing protein [Planctomycetes bacterium]|nr:HEAT repeat domain-containing protein [Planctomycetota bacterium]
MLSLAAVGDLRAAEPLLKRIGRTRDFGARKNSAIALGILADARVTEQLVQKIKGSDILVAHFAGIALGVKGDRRVTDELIRLLDDRSPRVQANAARALGFSGDPRAINSLAALIQNPDKNLRQAVYIALGRIGHPRCAASLVRALQDSHYRRTAAYWLGVVGDLNAVDSLVQTIRDSDAWTSGNAAKSIAWIGGPQALILVPKLLTEKEESVRRSTVVGMGLSQDSMWIESLNSALRDSSIKVRAAAVWALGMIGSPRAADTLTRLLEKGELRNTAMFALAEMGDVRVTNQLVSYLEDSSRLHRGTLDYSRPDAVDALGIIRSKDAFQVLVAALGDEDKRVRDRAPDALATIALQHGVEPLRSAARDSNERIRQGAVKALALLAEKRYELMVGTGVAKSSEMLATSNSPRARLDRGSELLARIRAAGSRARLGDQAAINQLKKGMKSSPIDAQIAAISGIAGARQATPKVIKDLKEALAETKSSTVRLKIIGEIVKANANDPDALAKDSDAIKNLQQYLKSEDPVERIYARQVLGETGQHGVADELVAALDDTNPLVQVHAAMAIIQILDAQAAADESEKNTNKTAPTSKD